MSCETQKEERKIQINNDSGKRNMNFTMLEHEYFIVMNKICSAFITCSYMNGSHSMHRRTDLTIVQNLSAKSKCIIYSCICQPDNVLRNSMKKFAATTNPLTPWVCRLHIYNIYATLEYLNILRNIFLCIKCVWMRKWYMLNIVLTYIWIDLFSRVHCLPSAWVIIEVRLFDSFRWFASVSGTELE